MCGFNTTNVSIKIWVLFRKRLIFLLFVNFQVTNVLEYDIPEDSNAIIEVKKCLEYVKQALEGQFRYNPTSPSGVLT